MTDPGNALIISADNSRIVFGVEHRGMKDNEVYYRSEWEMFRANPERRRAILTLVGGRRVSRVLDVGCGAAQELLPFVMDLNARGTGVDNQPEALRIAAEQFSKLGYGEAVDFQCCPAESLPFEAGTFDVVICRLALPYTLNDMALAEMSRVLRLGGLLILKIHHFRYYLNQAFVSIIRGRVRACLRAARVLVAGAWYHLGGRQCDNWLFNREVFQTRWKLRRVLASVGLAVVKELGSTNRSKATPSFLIEKR